MTPARTPTAMSLDLLRREGWAAQRVESRVSGVGVNRTRDLFGFIDIVAVRGDETLAVQATTKANISHRVRKIANAPLVGAVREAGWRIVVWGWDRDGELREVDCS